MSRLMIREKRAARISTKKAASSYEEAARDS
jgi:hypothetical protein